MNRRRVSPRLLATCTAALLLTSLGNASLARAQAAASEAALSPAKQLFADARKLVQDGKYVEACPKFEESLRLEVGIGTQFNLADCWEHIGRTASAQALFLGAAASAKAVGQTDREQVLRERAKALEPRMTRLVIEVDDTSPKLTVKRGDLPLDSDAFGKAVAVDPGKYTISARAPGKQPWEKVVEVSAGTPLVTVKVPALEAVKEEKKAEPAEVAPKAPPPAAPVATTGNRSRKIDYRMISVAGLGVAGIVVGTVQGLKYRSANKDAEEICPTSMNCTIKEIQDHDRLLDEASNARAWSYAGFAVGGASLVGAGLLWLFQPKASESAWRAAPEVTVSGSMRATLSGSF